MVVAVQKAIRGLGGRKGTVWRGYIAYIVFRGCVTTLSEEGKFVDAISEGSREAGLGRGEQAILFFLNCQWANYLSRRRAGMRPHCRSANSEEVPGGQC